MAAEFTNGKYFTYGCLLCDITLPSRAAIKAHIRIIHKGSVSDSDLYYLPHEEFAVDHPQVCLSSKEGDYRQAANHSSKRT